MFTFEIIAGVASVLGLVFSVAAFIQARSASLSARQARDAIITRTLADEFQLACSKMDELHRFVLHDLLPEAAYVAHELASTLSEIPYRRSPHLSIERKNELLNIRTQMQTLDEEISRLRRQPAKAKQKENFLRVCQESTSKLRENLAIIKGQLEAGGNT
jgi:hypothetical protein